MVYLTKNKKDIYFNNLPGKLCFVIPILFRTIVSYLSKLAIIKCKCLIQSKLMGLVKYTLVIPKGSAVEL